MALRLAGEDYSVVQGLDYLGWLREISVSSSDPALKVVQSGAGDILEIYDGGILAFQIRQGRNIEYFNGLSGPGLDFDQGGAGMIRTKTNNNLVLQPNGTGVIDLQKAIRNTSASNGGKVFIDDEVRIGQPLSLDQAINVAHVAAKTAAYTTTDADAIVPVDTTGGAVTITLGSATVEAGRITIVKDVGGSAGTSSITVDTEGTETIDGAASAAISTDYGVLRLYSDGSNWFTF
ncbi:MAG: hypothetical protein V3U26_01605 [Dehalococcoidia bacterium]